MLTSGHLAANLLTGNGLAIEGQHTPLGYAEFKDPLSCGFSEIVLSSSLKGKRVFTFNLQDQQLSAKNRRLLGNGFQTVAALDLKNSCELGFDCETRTRVDGIGTATDLEVPLEQGSEHLLG